MKIITNLLKLKLNLIRLKQTNFKINFDFILPFKFEVKISKKQIL